MYDLDSVGDESMIERLKVLVAKDNNLTAQLHAHVGEVDARKLYVGHACSSMFVYCVEVLKFSEGEAYKRIHAARAARTYPVIFELIAKGELHLSGITVLAAHLTPENHRELLAQATGKTKRAIEELLAARAPKPDAPPMIRKLPPPRFAATTTVPRIDPPKPAPQPQPQPLAEDRFKVQFTASRELKDKIAAAQALLRHQIPDGDLEEVFEHAIDELLTVLKRKKFAATDKPRDVE